MVLVGLAIFLVVFAVLFPILTNPAGAYDRWFPPETVEITDPVDDSNAPSLAGPTAQFRWETVAIERSDPSVYRIRLTSESLAPTSELVDIRWDFGDGRSASGASVAHDYAEIGSYTISLRVEDAVGQVDSVRGTVVVEEATSLFGAAGRVDEILDSDRGLDTFSDDISESLEGAVGDVGDEITNSLDSALGSIGTTVRGGVVVALFSMASLAATIVAWRTARIGVMLLTRDADAGARRSNATDEQNEDSDRHRLEAA